MTLRSELLPLRCLMGKLKLLLGLGVLFFALNAFAHDLPIAPEVHLFSTVARSDKAFVISDTVLLGADFVLTHKIMSTPSGCWTENAQGQPFKYPICHHPWELDPIARPFVMHGTALQVTYFAGSWVMDMAITYELRKHGHRKMARVVQGFALASSAWGVETCARNY